MDQNNNIIDKFKSWYRSLPDKKRYVEFFTAILTVPVLLTVIITNINNLKSQKQTGKNSPDITQPVSRPEVTVIEKIIKDNSDRITPAATTQPSPNPECKKQVGPVEIVYPDENELVTKNPVCIDISYQTGQYCAVVWSYRINNSSWSDYTDKSICLYNLDPGNKKLDLKIKSIASGDEVLLKRNFSVMETSVTPSPAEASSSANL